MKLQNFSLRVSQQNLEHYILVFQGVPFPFLPSFFYVVAEPDPEVGAHHAVHSDLAVVDILVRQHDADLSRGKASFVC